MFDSVRKKFLSLGSFVSGYVLLEILILINITFFYTVTEQDKNASLLWWAVYFLGIPMLAGGVASYSVVSSWLWVRDPFVLESILERRSNRYSFFLGVAVVVVSVMIYFLFAAVIIFLFGDTLQSYVIIGGVIVICGLRVPSVILSVLPSYRKGNEPAPGEETE